MYIFNGFKGTSQNGLLIYSLFAYIFVQWYHVTMPGTCNSNVYIFIYVFWYLNVFLALWRNNTLCRYLQFPSACTTSHIVTTIKKSMPKLPDAPCLFFTIAQLHIRAIFWLDLLPVSLLSLSSHLLPSPAPSLSKFRAWPIVLYWMYATQTWGLSAIPSPKLFLNSSATLSVT